MEFFRFHSQFILIDFFLFEFSLLHIILKVHSPHLYLLNQILFPFHNEINLLQNLEVNLFYV
jgi:hypothetical protein